MNISEAVEFLKQQVPDPSAGLPLELFYYVSGVTPMINVDLLVKDERGRALLAWRDDQHTGKGWHIPGGIIRFQETIERRIKKVAESEVGAKVAFDPEPLAVNQIIVPGKTIRGHFISLLYNCRLPGSFIPDNQGRAQRDPGYLKWHDRCPDDLLKYHEIYREYLQ